MHPEKGSFQRDFARAQAFVEQGLEEGVSISEFPTTVEAARAAHEAGVGVVMGAPNVVRGGSHSGNVLALGLAREGVLDILSSDYVPSSLLHSAFLLHQELGRPLPEALATVTSTPAQHLQMGDRGEIKPGKLADLAAWKRDVLTDPTALLDCAFVMKDGYVYATETVE